MARFKWDDDREFPFIENMDFLIAEARWAEKQFGKSCDEFTTSEAMTASALVTLRRHEIMYTLADAEAEQWTLRFINEKLRREPGDVSPEDGEPDPTEPTSAPVPTKNSGGRGGRSSSTSSD